MQGLDLKLCFKEKINFLMYILIADVCEVKLTGDLL